MTAHQRTALDEAAKAYRDGDWIWAVWSLALAYERTPFDAEGDAAVGFICGCRAVVERGLYDERRALRRAA